MRRQVLRGIDQRNVKHPASSRKGRKLASDWRTPKDIVGHGVHGPGRPAEKPCPKDQIGHSWFVFCFRYGQLHGFAIRPFHPRGRGAFGKRTGGL